MKVFDAHTEQHFVNWLQNYVAWEEMAEVEKSIRAYCEKYPGAQDGLTSWSELRRRAEKESKRI
jgi:hypothetical protein